MKASISIPGRSDFLEPFRRLYKVIERARIQQDFTEGLRKIIKMYRHHVRCARGRHYGFPVAFHVVAAEPVEHRHAEQHDIGLDALQGIADGQATKIFMPLETSGILGSLGALRDLFVDVEPTGEAKAERVTYSDPVFEPGEEPSVPEPRT